MDAPATLNQDRTQSLVESTQGFDAVTHAQSIVGIRYRVDESYEVGREKVREFARAVQDYHPVHWDETSAADYGYEQLIATPTFTAVLSGTAQRALTDMLVGYDLTMVMQTDQVLNFHRPIAVGDQLTCNLSLRSFRQAFGGDLFVIENVITDHYDEPVLTAYVSLIARTGQPDENQRTLEFLSRIVRQDTAPDTPPENRPPALRLSQHDRPERVPAPAPPPSPRARSFDSVSVGDPLPTRVVELSSGDLVNYAGVAGDPNPIHWSSETAELVGLEHGVVAHGMLTMAFGAGVVTSWLGDPGAIRQLSVRMTSPVHVGATQPADIEYSGKVKSLDPATRTATVAITAMHAGRKIFGRATAVVELS